MQALGPYAQLGIVAAAFWLFTLTLAAACIIAGALGQQWARRHGKQCPHCDYRAGPADMLIHRVLEHED